MYLCITYTCCLMLYLNSGVNNNSIEFVMEFCEELLQNHNINIIASGSIHIFSCNKSHRFEMNLIWLMKKY